MSTILVRTADAKDIAAVTDLVTELNREEGYEISASSQSLQTALFGEKAKVPMRALVAQADDGRLVGVVLFYWGYDTVSATYGYHLADIVVTKSQRGRGIGTQLYNRLAQQCLSENGQWISLTVLKQNARAQAFYTARGMVEIEVNFFAIGPQALARCAQQNLAR